MPRLAIRLLGKNERPREGSKEIMDDPENSGMF
jgi:hypothetical protein